MTRMQKRIFWALRKYETDLFMTIGDGARKLGFGVSELENGAICIRAYSMPEYFMKSHGWIEPAGGNFSRHIYRLTDLGRTMQAKVGTEFPAS